MLAWTAAYGADLKELRYCAESILWQLTNFGRISKVISGQYMYIYIVKYIYISVENTFYSGYIYLRCIKEGVIIQSSCSGDYSALTKLLSTEFILRCNNLWGGFFNINYIYILTSFLNKILCGAHVLAVDYSEKISVYISF